MVGAFRKEWPAADRNPRQAAGDRIVSRPEPLFGCPVARSRQHLHRTRMVAGTLGSLHKAGVEEDDTD